jgi:hypothetical protein
MLESGLDGLLDCAGLGLPCALKNISSSYMINSCRRAIQRTQAYERHVGASVELDGSRKNHGECGW